MEIDLSKRYNYKIRNKRTGDFFSNSRKATWQRSYAVLDLLNHKHGYNANTFSKLDEWEIVLIPLENPLTISAKDFLEYYKEEEEIKANNLKQKKQEQERARQEYLKNAEIVLLRKLKNKYPNI